MSQTIANTSAMGFSMVASTVTIIAFSIREVQFSTGS
jgi:hypothetical protein